LTKAAAVAASHRPAALFERLIHIHSVCLPCRCQSE
jgi:hypothetical protein